MNMVHMRVPMSFHGYFFRIVHASLFLILSFSPAIVFGQSLSVIGADVSYLDQIEKKGGIFRKEGVQKDALTILKELGFTHIRLRLWHSPAGEINGLNSTIAVARRAKALG
ncbi:MAG: glycosyl hydrolase 53 family protein, partial [Bacteroidetes bacterium]|nr:glycosyl hydrolase 53 family protein [Bacteroidota bacterium]